ncbi:cation channel sperm-associated auxiliary subunit TMEM249 [Eudromia elegans]
MARGAEPVASLRRALRRGPALLRAALLPDAEEQLARRMQANPLHPFQPQPPQGLVLQYYKRSLWKGLLLLAAAALCWSLLQDLEWDPQLFTWLCIYGLAAGLWLVLSSLTRWRLVLDPARGHYQLWARRSLWRQQPLHQIYVRLTRQENTSGVPYYSLELNGFGLEPIPLATLSRNWQRLARRLRLNYFDWREVSVRHRVRHWPPAPPAEAPQ